MLEHLVPEFVVQVVQLRQQGLQVPGQVLRVAVESEDLFEEELGVVTTTFPEATSRVDMLLLQLGSRDAKLHRPPALVCHHAKTAVMFFRQGLELGHERGDIKALIRKQLRIALEL